MLAATCQTTAADVASGAGAALVFGVSMGLFVLWLERTGGLLGSWREAQRWKRRGTRIWNWGLTALMVGGGAIGLFVAAIMALTHTTFSC